MRIPLSIDKALNRPGHGRIGQESTLAADSIDDWLCVPVATNSPMPLEKRYGNSYIGVKASACLPRLFNEEEFHALSNFVSA